MEKKFFGIVSASQAYSYMQKGFITSIIINLFTFVLLLFISLMKLGGISSFSYFYYYHFFILFAGIVLSYGIYRWHSFAFLVLFILLLVDKLLLLVYGLINPMIGLFVFIFLGYFLLRGYQGSLYWSGVSFGERESCLSGREGFVERNRGVISSFILVTVIIISGVVVHNIFVLLEKHFGLGFGFFRYPFGVFVTLFLSVLGMYPYVKKYVGTFHLVFANIIVLAFATSLSTLVPQSMSVPFQPLDFYPKAYGYLGHLYIFFSIDRIFYSFWYISLFVLLAFNILRVMFKSQFSLRKLGFYITHISLVFILVAVWYNYFFSYTGIIPLREGDMSNNVYLFKESKQKHNVDSKELDFYVRLDRFSTKNWESAYHIYVKKFKEPIPKSLPLKVYDRFSKNLPIQFKGVLAKAYKKEKKLLLSPALSILSTVGFTFLSTYRVGSYHYIFQGVDGVELERILRRIFLLFAYKGKDITANSIEEGKGERIYTTNISYKVLKYFENYRLGYLPIPNVFSASIFEGKVLSLLSGLFADIARGAYEKKGDIYELKSVYRKDANKRDNLAYVFASLSDNALLEGQVEVKNSAIGFNYLSGSDRQEVWLVEGRGKEGNRLKLNSGVELKYFWDIARGRVLSMLRARGRDIVISGKDRRIYMMRGGKLEVSKLSFNVPFALEKDGYGYFNYILPNYKEYHPYKLGIVNVPIHIDGTAFEKLLGDIVFDEKKEFMRSKAYMKVGKVWLLNPLFHYDELSRKEISLVLREAGFKLEPINPYLLLEVSYEESGVMKKELTSLSPRGLNVFMVPGSNYTLTFSSRRDMETKYWKSDLSVLELEGAESKEFKTVHRDRIEVNEYMYYSGYRFYQTDANKEDKSYSGIGVSVEPGLMYIYFGFITLSIGIITMFYFSLGKKRS